MSDVEARDRTVNQCDLRNSRQNATTRTATSHNAAYKSTLDRRNTKIMPCNADITMQPVRVGPIEAREDYPHISAYQGVLP